MNLTFSMGKGYVCHLGLYVVSNVNAMLIHSASVGVSTTTADILKLMNCVQLRQTQLRRVFTLNFARHGIPVTDRQHKYG